MSGLALLCLSLTVSPAQATFPGQNGKIAFSSSSTNPSSIETIEPDGTGRATLASGNSPVWSADGARLAFSLETYGPPPGSSTSQILAINADGSGRTTIYETCGSSCKAFVGGPSWSPDGSQLVVNFTVCGSSECGTGLSILNADGTPTTGGLGGVAGAGADWSPLASTIAFSRYSDFDSPVCGSPPVRCNSDVYTIGTDGTGETRLTNVPADDYGPSWSPDGLRIAFVSERDGNPEIYTMNADGTGQTRVTDDPAIDSGPVWSPDGSKIAFTSFYRASHPNTGDIYLMNPDGTGLTNLTKTLDISEGGPDWQPLSNEPPDCSGVTATPSSLRHHGFHTVTLAGATDPDSDVVTITIDGVTQDEPVGRRPDARPGSSAGTVQLRAQRSPRGDGRIYRIAFTASDGNESCSGVATVEVRRHKKQPAVDSAPPSYDSFDE